MVCQAASQTRFRALKHENGIAGNATIIVRVIACFQPLQDCQVSKRSRCALFSPLARYVRNFSVGDFSYALSRAPSFELYSSFLRLGFGYAAY